MVVAGSTAEDGGKYSLKQLQTEGLLRAVELISPDGKRYQFAANFGVVEVLWNSERIPAGECALKSF